MRFSILLVVLAAISPILATPGKDQSGRKPGTNVKQKAPEEIPKAEPGEIVLAKPKDFIGEDPGKGSSKNKIHPAIVVAHDPDTHIVKLAPIGHEHPGAPAVMRGSELGLPETPDKTAKPSIVSLGKPKEVHQNNLKVMGKLKEGAKRDPMPEKLTEEHLHTLQAHIIHHNPEPAEEGKGKKKAGKAKRELDVELRERYLLESMLDEW